MLKLLVKLIKLNQAAENIKESWKDFQFNK